MPCVERSHTLLAAALVVAALGAVLALRIVPLPWIRPPRRPNVILVTLDTVRADRLGGYGYARDTSPRLDAFTRDAVRFDHAMTATTFTTPSHASILTGLYPAAHGALTNGWGLPPAAETLTKILADGGYETAAFVAARWVLGRQFGFDQGFTTFEEGNKGPRTAEEITRGALRFLDLVQERSFFMWLHYYDAHCPYQPPAPFEQMFTEGIQSDLDTRGRCGKNSYNRIELSDEDVRLVNGLYDGAIRYLDQHLGVLFTTLSRRGLLDGTIVVIVGDHGEELHDRGSFGHNLTLYECETRVPLWIRLPGARSSLPRPVEQPVSTVDIAPTILQLVGLSSHGALDGRSLVPLLGGDDSKGHPVQERWPPDRAVFSRIAPEEGSEDRVALRLGQWKLHLTVRTGHAELYDLGSDGSESVEISQERPEAREQLLGRAQSWLMRQSQRLQTLQAQAVSDEVREQLRALGYVNP